MEAFVSNSEEMVAAVQGEKMVAAVQGEEMVAAVQGEDMVAEGEREEMVPMQLGLFHTVIFVSLRARLIASIFRHMNWPLRPLSSLQVDSVPTLGPYQAASFSIPFTLENVPIFKYGGDASIVSAIIDAFQKSLTLQVGAAVEHLGSIRDSDALQD